MFYLKIYLKQMKMIKIFIKMIIIIIKIMIKIINKIYKYKTSKVKIELHLVLTIKL